jgi:hypothetical protein
MSIQHLLDASEVTELTVIDPDTGTSKLKPITPAHRLALMAIADDASDHTNMSWPGFEKICRWALVRPSQGHKIVRDLIESGYIERVQKAHTGRRTVYLVKLPPRPRRQPVDNPLKEGPLGRTHSRKSLRSDPREGVLGRTPLPINSPQIDIQSSTESHQDARASAKATTGFIAGWVDRIRPRPRLDLLAVRRAVAEQFPDLAGDPMFPATVERFASEVLLKAPAGAHHPTAYVVAAFGQDFELQRRFVDAIGEWT